MFHHIKRLSTSLLNHTADVGNRRNLGDQEAEEQEQYQMVMSFQRSDSYLFQGPENDV